MSKTFNEIGEDLKTYLLDAHSNYKGLKNVSTERYNNLKVYMQGEVYQTFHTIVRIGISEAVFILPEGLIYSGSLGMDEKFVSRWLQRDTIQQELNSHWKSIESNL